MSEPIVNKVKANTKLQTLDLATLFYDPVPIIELDIKAFLHMELLLKESDFRDYLKNHDWSQYEGKHVALTCSVDALVQVWAFMILQSKLQPYAATVVFGGLDDLEEQLWRNQLDQIDWQSFEGRPVVVKGCSDIELPPSTYVEATRRLMPYAKKISYGEPCSTVPVWKQ